MALLQLNNTVFTELVLDARYSLSVVACSNFSCKQSTSVALSELVCMLLSLFCQGGRGRGREGEGVRKREERRGGGGERERERGGRRRGGGERRE